MSIEDKLKEMTGSEFNKLGNDYLNEIKDHLAQSEYVTDKMPVNFRLIGFIKLLFPNAKVIHCQRNPLDNCLSLFNIYFSSFSPKFSCCHRKSFFRQLDIKNIILNII